MGLLSGVIGGTLHGVGNVIDNVTPGSGQGRITNVGKAVTNPNLVLSNAGGLFSHSPAFTPAKASAGGSQQNSTGNSGVFNQGSGYLNGNYNGNSAGRSGGSGSSTNPALAAVYDAQLGRLNGILGGLGGQQAAQENIIGGQFNQSRANLDTSHNRALTDLQTQEDQVQHNKAQSLNDLSARGRNLMQALNNQFGTMGAGSSSASQVLAPFAIAQQQNRLGGDVNQQAGTQINAIDTDRNRVEQDYKDNMDQLEQQRMNSLLQVGQQFQDLAHQIQDQMTNASAQKASALNGAYNQAVSTANAQVAQIEQGYQSKLGDINNYYSNYHPTANTDIAPVDNNVQALNTSGFTNVGVDPSATQQAVTAAYIDPSKQDQNQLLY